MSAFRVFLRVYALLTLAICVPLFVGFVVMDLVELGPRSDGQTVLLKITW